MSHIFSPHRVSLVLALATALLLVGCSHPPAADSKDVPHMTASPDPLTAASLPPPAPGAVRSVTGPDLCTVQIWATIAFERANQRDEHRAYLDRVAWELAQHRINEQLTQYPTTTREAAIQTGVDTINEVYKHPSLAQCNTPQ